jgi:hypothetical protein
VLETQSERLLVEVAGLCNRERNAEHQRHRLNSFIVRNSGFAHSLVECAENLGVEVRRNNELVFSRNRPIEKRIRLGVTLVEKAPANGEARVHHQLGHALFFHAASPTNQGRNVDPPRALVCLLT